MSVHGTTVVRGRQGLIRALLLSLLAFAVPVSGAFLFPAELGDYEALLWLTALIPAFLLAYQKGWRGVATTLAFGMAVLSITYAVTQTLGHGVPDLLFAVVTIYLVIALLLGWLAERFRRDQQRELMEGAAFTDVTTGLPNRKHADLHLEIEFNAAQRGRSVAVVMLDIDHFAAYNSRHGTIAGDEILRLIGIALRQNTRRMNLSARYGDDEFVAVLGGSDDDGALVFVSRFQDSLQNAAQQLALPTVSVGIATYRATMRNGQELMEAAEEALRRARKDGSGRVRVYGRASPVAELPRVEGAVIEPARAMPEGRGSGRKALVVVDETPVRILLARYLTDHGFKVEQVSNVVDGVQALSAEFDLLVADISLTEGVGAELVRAAKLRWPMIQVIGLAHIDGNGAPQIDTLNAGVDRYIERPLDLIKLRQHLTDLIARHDRMAAPVTENRQLSLEFQAEKAEAVNALRRNEEEYRSVVESLQEIIFRLDANGNFIFLNWAWAATCGYPLDDTLGKSLVSFVHEDDRPRTAELLAALTSAKLNEARDEIRIAAQDGTLRWLELRARPWYDAHGSINGASGTLDDITWQKLAEEQLRRTEAASRAILAALPDVVMGVSRKGVVLSYEGGANGASSSIGRSLEEVFPAQIAHKFRQNLSRLFETRDVQVCEYEEEVGASLSQYEARLAIIGDDEAVVILRNISDRKRLEEQLRQSQKLEAIGRLAGGLAHDFNNLLTVVQGNAHLLMEEFPQDESAHDFAQQISTAATRGADLIRQLLAFGRKQVMQPRVLNLNGVVSTVQGLLPTLIGEAIRLEVDLQEDLGLVKADPGQIEQVLVNLASYAKMRMPAGGVIRIRTRNVRDQDYDPQMIPLGSKELVCLTVEDNGSPLDEQTRMLVFEPFSTDLTGPQSGLRLATVYGIVTQSGGTVRLEDAPSGGACFEIFLPRVDR